MKDDTRLRGDLAPREDPQQAIVTIAEDEQPMAAPIGTGVYAALDLGTNNCRLLIARPTSDGFRVVDSFSRIIRLGEGMAATGRISDAALARAISALGICRDKIRSRRARRLRLIATEACRSASNADEFCHNVQHATGIALEVIDRETEAKLAVIGCSPLIDHNGRGAILFDIGGGSSELVRIARDPDGTVRIAAWMSIPLGVVTLAERFGGRVVTTDSYAAMVDAVTTHVAPFAARHGGDLAGMHLLGTSGTVTTLAGLHLDLVRYDRRRIDGVWMSAAELDATIARLLGMSYHDRAQNQCIGSERADLVLAGCAILDAVRAAFPLPRLRVADRGLREGMLVEMMREDGVMGDA
ncbi:MULTISPECIES: Ppx/GppA phosphatase family protein [Rhodopseudomonas]|uniref:Exopolyphosphatase n=1 Tax=Rhodopseudomonas palustris TaxID=1076 RepID=A0A0D7EFY7_RHOPL|nr:MULTISPECIES: Ppx/GppA phosphatase family protein [Rhodopseudomonas]KIZ39576.1 exopolyphosphatase [Rhodopseudomonas palustris]MDF3810432.1 Ppx/GppA phosphatase family protein [Rhodopseudomonas sp. BAL398]WOK19588.1 Ppx/GppA phosphatase family protein [Rhodopseudomonas sp. BAL398]